MSEQDREYHMEHRRSTREAYDRLAPVWSETTDEGPFNGFLERPARRALVPRPITGARILDAGCGSKAQCEWLLDQGAQVVGIDLSPAMVHQTVDRCGGRGHFLVADLSEPLPLEAASLDGVTCSLALHYLEDWSVPLASCADAGFVVERLVEPQPSPAAVGRFPAQLAPVVGVPWFIVYRLRLAP